ncbi:MAG: hypothetical protein FIA95_17275 [Gemmatimonadetes bacterium]|nr:hypothetical protein [Gemmatimonadota bacterium]
MRAPSGADPRVTVNSDRSPWALWSVPRGGGEPEPFFDDPALGATRPDACPLTGRIAFTGIRGDRSELFLLNADGTGLRHVPVGDPPRTRVYYPSWFPDGDRVAVTDYQRRQALSVSVSSGEVVPLTDPSEISAGMAAASGAADGRLLLAFAGQPRGPRYDVERNRIWLRAQDGSIRPLDHGRGRTPAWSPKATCLAYSSTRPRRAPPLIMLRRLLGSGRSTGFVATPDPDELAPWRSTALTPADHAALHPKWSPDGAEVVMMATSLTDGRSGIAVVPA